MRILDKIMVADHMPDRMTRTPVAIEQLRNLVARLPVAQIAEIDDEIELRAVQNLQRPFQVPGGQMVITSLHRLPKRILRVPDQCEFHHSPPLSFHSIL